MFKHVSNYASPRFGMNYAVGRRDLMNLGRGIRMRLEIRSRYQFSVLCQPQIEVDCEIPFSLASQREEEVFSL